MRVLVNNGEHNIRILLPTRLVFSRLTALIGGVAIEKYAPECSLSLQQIDAVFAEFRRIKSKYGRWELVDVQSSNGQTVNVIL